MWRNINTHDFGSVSNQGSHQQFRHISRKISRKISNSQILLWVHSGSKKKNKENKENKGLSGSTIFKLIFLIFLFDLIRKR